MLNESSASNENPARQNADEEEERNTNRTEGTNVRNEGNTSKQGKPMAINRRLQDKDAVDRDGRSRSN